jgi:hypothetical protein
LYISGPGKELQHYRHGLQAECLSFVLPLAMDSPHGRISRDWADWTSSVLDEPQDFPIEPDRKQTSASFCHRRNSVLFSKEITEFAHPPNRRRPEGLRCRLD